MPVEQGVATLVLISRLWNKKTKDFFKCVMLDILLGEPYELSLLPHISKPFSITAMMPFLDAVLQAILMYSFYQLVLVHCILDFDL